LFGRSVGNVSRRAAWNFQKIRYASDKAYNHESAELGLVTRKSRTFPTADKSRTAPKGRTNGTTPRIGAIYGGCSGKKRRCGPAAVEWRERAENAESADSYVSCDAASIIAKTAALIGRVRLGQSVMILAKLPSISRPAAGVFSNAIGDARRKRTGAAAATSATSDREIASPSPATGDEELP